MKDIPEAEEIVRISEEVTQKWHREEGKIRSLEEAISVLSSSQYSGIAANIEALSIINTTLWHQEDRARDTDAHDSVIAEVKRTIDGLNEARVNMVEEIDSILYKRIEFNIDAPLNTETPGSVMDRLAILCLKEYHMRAEAEREDSTDKHREKCAEKLSGIIRQIKDLSAAYDQLIEEIGRGERRYAMYRQYKMYNDPELNPVLYSKKKVRR